MAINNKISGKMVYLRRLISKKNYYMNKFLNKLKKKQTSINIIKKIIRTAKNKEDILFFQILLSIYKNNYLDLDLEAFLKNGKKEKLKEQLIELYKRKIEHIKKLKRSRDIYLKNIYKKNYDKKYLKELESKDKQIQKLKKKAEEIENKLKNKKEIMQKIIKRKLEKLDNAEKKVDNAKNIKEIANAFQNLNLQLMQVRKNLNKK